MTSTVKTQNKNPDLPWLIGLSVLAVMGIAAWYIQLSRGMSVTGISQAIPWGLYVVGFFVLAGLASGLVILAALSDLKILKDLQPYRLTMLIGAIAGYVAAGVMILMDIGKPVRVLRFLTSPSFTSPFVWDFALLALSVIVTAIYLVLQPKGKVVPIIAGLVALGVLLVEGFILSMSAGGALWHGGLKPVQFLVEGLLAAASILLIIKYEPQANKILQNLLLTLLPTIIIFHIAEIGAILFTQTPDAEAGLAVFWNGELAPLFWAQILLGVGLPFALLLWKGSDRKIALTASVLVLLGILVDKLIILVSGQAPVFMQSTASYLPTPLEYAGIIGMLGLAGVLFLLGKQVHKA